MAPEFEWDAKKAEENLKKHEVAFEEAVAVFAVVQAALWLTAGVSKSAIRERCEVSDAEFLSAEISVALVKGRVP